MKVWQLKNILDQHGDGLPVILAIDEEGNAFHDLADVERSFIRADGRDIDVLHPDDAEGDEAEALVFWP